MSEMKKVHVNKRMHELLEHPYQKFCGIRLIEAEMDRVVCELETTDKITNLSGKLHGGVIYSMADVTCMLLTLMQISEAEYAVSHDIHVSLLSAVSQGNHVTFEARILRKGRRLVFVECQVWKHDSGRRDAVALAVVTKSLVAAPCLDSPSSPRKDF